MPQLVIVDNQDIVAHWSGKFGFTDGRQLLGTRPEKDVGFPYASTCWGNDDVNNAVANEMLRFSWQSYLVNSGRYVDWIDRGRTRPTHGEWSSYLEWVAARIGLDVTHAEVRKIASSEDHKHWQLSCRSVVDDSMFAVEGDGLVITGPGVAVTIPGQPANHPRVTDGGTFWLHVEEFARLRETVTKPLHIGVIGTGETAAAIVIALLNALQDRSFIEVISPYGVLYSRDEGFEENRLFSDPDGRLARLRGGHEHELSWSRLTENDRREFVRRTDRGVFSLHDQYDYVIVAIGFNPLWFTTLLDEPTRERLGDTTGSFERRTTERAIGEDLSVRDFEPRLHLPMLAGVSQGPGFPNLSCLGLLSDRILSSYGVIAQHV